VFSIIAYPGKTVNTSVGEEVEYLGKNGSGWVSVRIQELLQTEFEEER
jgi:hypothetical protein